jgi:hypothetical protein
VPRTALCAALLATLAMTGCSLKASDEDSGGGSVGGAPPVGVEPSDEKATEQLGFPIVATRNTTRVSGKDPVADAAGVASALFPATEAATRPPAVVVADKGDWQGIVAASALASAPVRAPILLSDGGDLPSVTSETLSRLKPKGIDVPDKGAQAILVGDKPPPPDDLKSTVIKTGDDPYARAAAVDKFASVARGKPSPNVVIASGEKPEYATPAAAWAGRSGDAVLFVTRNGIPGPTKAALEQHEKPRIYILGPESVISKDVEKQLGELGKVKRVGEEGAVENAIAFASYKSRDFGWGPIAPGGNYTVANATRPGDAAAAAGLGANGIFAPLLLTGDEQLPRSLEGFFLDVQPGYYAGSDPRQSVYNHIWILGGTGAVSEAAQGRLDSVAALVTIDKSAR